ncbi:effector-associated domain EAD1-containing protein [Micromonospora sp. CA-240977]|uniref:effector-associated domain EAD1-containing protein n=1 Tax=Micromonospora sp. CA-240977 TaxID=3239957 RepID=UPI003D945514
MCAVRGHTAEQLNNALRDAFRPPDRLDMLLLHSLDRHRHDITMADDYLARVFHLIQAADSEGWLADLVGAALEARPAHAGLRSVATALGLTALSDNAERFIDEYVPFQDSQPWRQRLGTLEGQVCRLELVGPPARPLGSGFLVGPDVCMTAGHVVAALRDGRVRPEQVVARFDFRRAADGRVVNDGTTYPLARQWRIATYAASAADRSADPARLPGPDELDVALVRLAEPAGVDAVGRAGALPDAPRRGWLTASGHDDALAADRPLIMLQYPGRDPLQLAFGTVLDVNANGTRVRHRVNTQRGSSGSPCFSADLTLVALHIAGDPDLRQEHDPTHNIAVPMAAIRDRLRRDGLAELVFPALPGA